MPVKPANAAQKPSSRFSLLQLHVSPPPIIWCFHVWTDFLLRGPWRVHPSVRPLIPSAHTLHLQQPFSSAGLNPLVCTDTDNSRIRLNHKVLSWIFSTFWVWWTTEEESRPRVENLFDFWAFWVRLQMNFSHEALIVFWSEAESSSGKRAPRLSWRSPELSKNQKF